MNTPLIENAVIRSAEIEYGHDFWLNPVLTFEMETGVQGGFGQFVFCIPDEGDSFTRDKRVVGPAFGTFITCVLDVVGVEKWSQLAGRNCRVARTASRIYGIGHIIKDRWFYPDSEWFDALHQKWDNHRHNLSEPIEPY